MSFGDGIDWDFEARRQAAEPSTRPGASELVTRLTRFCSPPARVIDCGCNIGRFAPLLVDAGYDYTGVDQSAVALKIATERYGSEAKFVEGFLWGLTDLDLGMRFDIALSCAVLQHNTLDEKRRILSEIAATVTPGGLFAMFESTVKADTRTQLTQAGWIKLVESFGFELLDLWHPNPEYGIDDHYLFRRSA